MTDPADWLALNQANWDERVSVHLSGPPEHYSLAELRSGGKRLDRIVSAVLGPVAGLRVAHLQCHFGMDTLMLARQGASVVGVDFSPPAIAQARALAQELGLSDRARFIEANVYDAVTEIGEPAAFDRVFVSWGALNWLPDIPGWARVVATLLKPGGFLALAEGHPAAYVFDDLTATPDGRPGWYAPYLAREPLLEDRPEDYANPDVPLTNSRTVEFLHPLSDIIMGLIDAGLRLDQFHEHDCVSWQMFQHLHRRARGEYVWPDRPWLPLSYSLRASKP